MKLHNYLIYSCMSAYYASKRQIQTFLSTRYYEITAKSIHRMTNPLLEVQIIPNILDIFHMPLMVMVYAPPPSNIITSLTSLWLLINILWKLSNIPTEVTTAKLGCWLLPHHKMFHSFSALRQPTHFRSTPSAPI